MRDADVRTQPREQTLHVGTKARFNKKGRHLLGGTGAAAATHDWGESSCVARQTFIRRTIVYPVRGGTQGDKIGVRRTDPHAWIGLPP